jgi:hypothetical protein
MAINPLEGKQVQVAAMAILVEKLAHTVVAVAVVLYLTQRMALSAQ